MHAADMSLMGGFVLGAAASDHGPMGASGGDMAAGADGMGGDGGGDAPGGDFGGGFGGGFDGGM